MNLEKRIYLIHVYGDFPRGKNRESRLQTLKEEGKINMIRRERRPYSKAELDFSSSFSALAAGELYHNGDAGGFFITTELQCPSGKTIAEVIKGQLSHYVPEEVILIDNSQRNTRGEVRHFKRVAKKKGWNNLGVIVKEGHSERSERAVKRIFRRRSNEVIIKRAEEVLLQEVSEKHNERYKSVVEKWRGSEEERAFIERDKIINRVDSIPLIGGFLLDIADRLKAAKDFEVWVLQKLSRK